MSSQHNSSKNALIAKPKENKKQESKNCGSGRSRNQGPLRLFEFLVLILKNLKILPKI